MLDVAAAPEFLTVIGKIVKICVYREQKSLFLLPYTQPVSIVTDPCLWCGRYDHSFATSSAQWSLCRSDRVQKTLANMSFNPLGASVRVRGSVSTSTRDFPAGSRVNRPSRSITATKYLNGFQMLMEARSAEEREREGERFLRVCKRECFHSEKRPF